MEMRGSVAITEATVGMNRVGANEIVKKLLTMYEDKIDDAPIGEKYHDCHDIATGRPLQQYVELYGEVMEELRSMGFPLKQQ